MKQKERENNNQQSAEERLEDQKPGREEAVGEERTLEEKQPEKEQTEEELLKEADNIQEQLEAQKDKYIRLMAEFDNFKRRTSKEYERMIESANERLMLDIIDARENFERAIKIGKENQDYEKFYEGMKLIFGKLEQALEKNGLSVFGEPGEQFDPNLHDAMLKQPHPEIPEDHIIDTYEKGYRLRNHVIKHAKVIVSSGAPQKDEVEQDKKEQVSE